MMKHPLGEASKSGDSVADDLRAVFGGNLRAARLKAGLSQAQVAARTSLTQQYVSQVETGHQNITIATMEALARVVGRNVSVLLRRARGQIKEK